MLDELISIDLCGKTAHFRKFYSTSSALTHTIPPRTTILGILAAVIGEKRDSYYENMDDLLLGVKIISPMRKIFQKHNFLKIADSEKNVLNLYAGIASNRTQTSVELIIPTNIRKDDLCFRIFVGSTNRNHEKFAKLKHHLKNELNVFGTTLGLAHLLGNLDNYTEYENFGNNVDSTCFIDTAVATDQICKILSKNVSLEQDSMPLRMKINSVKGERVVTRIATDVRSMLYSIDGSSFEVELNCTENIFSVETETGNFNVALI